MSWFSHWFSKKTHIRGSTFSDMYGYAYENSSKIKKKIDSHRKNFFFQRNKYLIEGKEYSDFIQDKLISINKKTNLKLIKKTHTYHETKKGLLSDISIEALTQYGESEYGLKNYICEAYFIGNKYRPYHSYPLAVKATIETLGEPDGYDDIYLDVSTEYWGIRNVVIEDEVDKFGSVNHNKKTNHYKATNVLFKRPYWILEDDDGNKKKYILMLHEHTPGSPLDLEYYHLGGFLLRTTLVSTSDYSQKLISREYAYSSYTEPVWIVYRNIKTNNKVLKLSITNEIRTKSIEYTFVNFLLKEDFKTHDDKNTKFIMNLLGLSGTLKNIKENDELKHYMVGYYMSYKLIKDFDKLKYLVDNKFNNIDNLSNMFLLVRLGIESNATKHFVLNTPLGRYYLHEDKHSSYSRIKHYQTVKSEKYPRGHDNLIYPIPIEFFKMKMTLYKKDMLINSSFGYYSITEKTTRVAFYQTQEFLTFVGIVGTISSIVTFGASAVITSLAVSVIAGAVINKYIKSKYLALALKTIVAIVSSSYMQYASQGYQALNKTFSEILKEEIKKQLLEPAELMRLSNDVFNLIQQSVTDIEKRKLRKEYNRLKDVLEKLEEEKSKQFDSYFALNFYDRKLEYNNQIYNSYGSFDNLEPSVYKNIERIYNV